MSSLRNLDSPRISDVFPLHVKAVMIDLDGTMLDTVQDLTYAVNVMLGKLGARVLEESLVRTFVGKGLPHLVQCSLKASFGDEPDDALMERAMPIYISSYQSVNGKHTTMFPGVREGLEALKNAGFPMACVTNKSERFTTPLLKHMGIADYFSVVVCGDTLPKRKPDPLPLTHACQRLGVQPHEMLMIGDSLNDTQAARAAGCPVFCVNYGYNEGTDVRELDVDAIVETIHTASTLILTS